MKNFLKTFHQFDAVWEECYLGVLAEEGDKPFQSKQDVVDYLDSHRSITTLIGEEIKITKTKEKIADALKPLEVGSAKNLLKDLLQKAARYASSVPLTDKDAEVVSTAFDASFFDPKIYANTGDMMSWTSVTESTFDYLFVIVDGKNIVVFLSVQDE